MDSGIESTESSNGSTTENPLLHDIQFFSKNQEISRTEEARKKKASLKTIFNDTSFRTSLNLSCPELLEKVNNVSIQRDNVDINKSTNRPMTFIKTSSDYGSVSPEHKINLNVSFPKQIELNFKSDSAEKFYESKNFDFHCNRRSFSEALKFSPKQSDETNPLLGGCKLEIHFPNDDPLNLNVHTASSCEPNSIDEANTRKAAAVYATYYGPLAVLPYESRELQRKFKHYRHKLKQINKDLTCGKPKEKKLRTAASLNNTDLVSSLLMEGVNPNSTDSRSRTPLHIAASKGYTDVVKILLQHDADPKQKDVIGNTALHLAACTSHIETVTLLLKAGTDAKEPDNSGFSPLHLANSRLRLMQKDVNPSSLELRKQVLQIIEMMEVYMKHSGNTEDAETLASLTNKLSLSDPNSQGDNEFKSLLNSLQGLTLSKPKVD